LLEHAERQLAAAEAVGAVGILGRFAAPRTLTGEARLLLRFAPCTTVGAADTVAGVKHTIYSSGNWVGVRGGGGTAVLREALGVWKVRTSWLGSVSLLDTLSTYAFFLGCQRNAALVARAVAAAHQAAADAETLLAAASEKTKGGRAPPRRRQRTERRVFCFVFLLAAAAPSRSIRQKPAKQRRLMISLRQQVRPKQKFKRLCLRLTLRTSSTVQEEGQTRSSSTLGKTRGDRCVTGMSGQSVPCCRTSVLSTPT